MNKTTPTADDTETGLSGWVLSLALREASSLDVGA
jgi:hypothetical protein